MKKVENFEYQSTLMDSNVVEEFLNTGVYQTEYYIRALEKMKIKNFDVLCSLMSRINNLRKALEILAKDEFYDDEDISVGMCFCSIVEANVLIKYLDDVILSILERYCKETKMNK